MELKSVVTHIKIKDNLEHVGHQLHIRQHVHLGDQKNM